MNINSLNQTMSLILQLADTRKSTQPILDLPTKPAYTPRPIQQPFPTATPESQGIPSDKLRTYLTTIGADRSIAAHQIMVLRNGNLLAHAAFGAQECDTWKYTFSGCKSVTSLAIGILIGEGKLRTDTKVLSILDEQIPPLARFRLADLTVHHLLTMTSGILFNEAEAMTQENWVYCCLNSALTAEPGKQFHYNSLNTYLLAAIVHKITGENLTDYLRPRLFDPLGIRDIYWETCPRGIERGGWGLYLRPTDFAKLGQLVLQDGQWNGVQLVPSDYLHTATTAQVEAPEEYGAFNYGYQIWVGRDGKTFLFNGMLGQNVLGFKDTNILVIINAGNPDLFQTNAFFAQTLEFFSQSFTSALPENPAAVRALRQSIDNMSAYHRPQRAHWFRPALPKECATLNHQTLIANDLHSPSTGLLPVVLQGILNLYATGLESIHFLIESDKFYMDYCEKAETYRLPIGFAAPEITEIRVQNTPFRVATSGAFAHDEDGRLVLKLRVDFLELPSSRFLRIYLGPDGNRLRQSEAPDEQLILKNMTTFTGVLQSKPIIGPALAKIDLDYFNYRIERLFRPSLRMDLKK